jgi:hypothetical protein
MLTFPWPPAPLKPNVKSHWATKAKATKEYKEMCFYLGIHGIAPNLLPTQQTTLRS